MFPTHVAILIFPRYGVCTFHCDDDHTAKDALESRLKAGLSPNGGYRSVRKRRRTPSFAR